MEAYSYLNLALENFNVFLMGNIRRGLYSFPGPYPNMQCIVWRRISSFQFESGP